MRWACHTQFTQWISVDILCSRYCRRRLCWGQYTEAGGLLWATCLQRGEGVYITCIYTPGLLGLHPSVKMLAWHSASATSPELQMLFSSPGDPPLPSLWVEEGLWFPSCWILTTTHAHLSVHFWSTSLRFLCRQCSPKAGNSKESSELWFRNRLVWLDYFS